MPKSTLTNTLFNFLLQQKKKESKILTGVQMRHETAQAQPIIIDARLGVRFVRYVNGRVMEKYRSKQISNRFATDAFDIV